MSIVLEGWGGGSLSIDGWGHLAEELIVDRHQFCLTLSIDNDEDVVLGAIEATRDLGMAFQSTVATALDAPQTEKDLGVDYQGSVTMGMEREEDC